MVKKIIVTLIIVGLLLPGLIFAQEKQYPALPENLQEAKEIGERALKGAEKEIPFIKKMWGEEAVPLLQKTWYWLKTNIWSRIEKWIGPEIEKRKHIFKQNIEKEKEEIKDELKKEAPKVGKSLWERFKELIK